MLMKIRENMRGKEQGFTLIELIVVLAILAVLALLAVPRFASILEQSRLKTHNQNIEQVSAAIELYAADHTNLTGLSIANLVSSNYLKQTPTPPYSGAPTAYTLTVAGSGTSQTVTIDPGWSSSSGGTYATPAGATQVFPTVARP